MFASAAVLGTLQHINTHAHTHHHTTPHHTTPHHTQL
jgi:hypothetical protein